MSEGPILVRTFASEIGVESDGRTVEVFCVPFDAPAEVADPPDFRPYREAFVRGAFAGAARAPNRVYLDFEHERGIGGVLGHAEAFEEQGDGLYGRFRVTEHSDGDKALALVREDVLGGASIAFAALRSRRADSGVIERTRVHLDRVSLCRVGAYPEARVLAVRSELVSVERVDAFEEQLQARLAAVGIRIGA
jgi:HK97 family phage prohead protease